VSATHAETQTVEPKGLSWQAWLALIYVVLLFPVGWGNFSHLLPGVHAVVANGSRGGWYSFWGTICVIEWIGFLLCLWALRAEGRSGREIGLYSPRLRLYLILFVVAIVGFGATIFVARGLGLVHSRHPNANSLFSFTSAPERFFWLAASMTAAVCEETMFRGFAITYLRKLMGSTWLAVLLATFAFAYVHGGFHQRMILFVYRFVIGLIFAGVYLWRGTLLPAMFLHFVIDAFFAV
jgi:uncharacterized protein